MTRLPEGELRALTEALLRACGASPEHAREVTEVLVWSDRAGRDAHGVWRLPILCERLRKGGIRGDARPAFERTGPATGRVHGAGAAGYWPAKLAMEHAIALAREQGIGAVAATHSNHLGAAAYYANQAALAGMVGIATSNSVSKVLPHGGARKVLGTNPIAFGAPLPSGEALLFDMSTAMSAGSTVRRNVEQGKKMDDGVLVDQAGKPTTQPALKEVSLLPFGGAKGFGLGLAVEILCGALAGPGVGPTVHSMYDEPAANGDNGHFLIAIDIARFQPVEEYRARMESLIAALEASGEPGAVRLPGASRWRAYRENATLGIPLNENSIAGLLTLCAELGMPAPASLSAASKAA